METKKQTPTVKIERNVVNTANNILIDPLYMHCVEEECEESTKSIPQLTRTASTPISSRETTPTGGNKTILNSSFRMKRFTPPLNRCFSISTYSQNPNQLGCNLSPLSFNYLMQSNSSTSENNETPQSYESSKVNPSSKVKASSPHGNILKTAGNNKFFTGQSATDLSSSSHSDTEKSQEHLNLEKPTKLEYHKAPVQLPTQLPKPKLYTLSATTAATAPSVHSMRRERYLSRRTISDQGPNHHTHLWGYSSPGLWGRRKDPKRTSAPSMAIADSTSPNANGSYTGTAVSSPSSSSSITSGTRNTIFIRSRRSWAHQPIYKRR